MAKQVENRVVEMEFKNKDFEKAVAVTLDSIEKLNEKLDSLNDVNVKGFGLSSLPIIIGILSEFTLIGNLKNSSSLESMHWPSDITYPLLHL